MEDNFKKQQDFMLEMNRLVRILLRHENKMRLNVFFFRITLERQIQMQNQMRERMVASQVTDGMTMVTMIMLSADHTRWRGPGRCSSGLAASTSSPAQQCWRDSRGEKSNSVEHRYSTSAVPVKIFSFSSDPNFVETLCPDPVHRTQPNAVFKDNNIISGLRSR